MNRPSVSSRDLVLLVLVLIFALGATRGSAQNCTNTGRTGATPVPEFGPTGTRLWGALQPVDQGSIPGRRDSTQELTGAHFPDQDAPEFRDVDEAAGLLFVTTPYGFDLWDARTTPEDPTYVSSRDGYAGDFATWQGVVGENNRVFEAGDTLLDGDSVLFFEAGKHGAALWRIDLATLTPTLLYQEWGQVFRNYRDVELVRLAGRIYAYATSSVLTGVQVFDVTAALGLSACVEDAQAGGPGCGVHGTGR